MLTTLLFALLGAAPAFASDSDPAAALRHAISLEAAGEKDSAYAEFERITRTSPDDHYTVEAWLHIGEYWFDKDDAAKALAAYRNAIGGPGGDREGFAAYKIAWCQFKLGDIPQATLTMVGVVDAANTSAAVRDEALKDLVRFFADGGEVAAATAFFAAHGRPDLARDTALRLAALSEEDGFYEVAIGHYRAAIASDLHHARNPALQAGIVVCFRKIGKVDEAWAAMEILFASYAPASEWGRGNAADAKALADAAASQERALRSLALDLHTEAKKLRTGEEAQRRWAYAEQAYARYIVLFTASPNIGEMRYSYAELLYTRKKFAAAYEQYMAVVALDPAGPHAKFCAESAIFAADELFVAEAHRGGSGRSGESRNAPHPLAEWGEKLLRALDQFAALYPDDPKIVNVIYKAGFLLHNQNQFAESAVRFRRVIAMVGWTEESEQAANLTLDGLLLAEDWGALRDTAKAFYDQPGFGPPAWKAQMLEIYKWAGEKAR